MPGKAAPAIAVVMSVSCSTVLAFESAEACDMGR